MHHHYQHSTVADPKQDRIFVSFIFVSMALHILAFTLHQWSLFKPPKPLINEWSIDTDLIVEADKAGGEPQDLKSKPLLPQLPKTFTIAQPERPDESLDEVKKEEKPKEDAKPGPSPNEVKKEVDPALLNTKADAAQLLENEALMRLKLEQLREQQAKDKNSDLAKLSAEILKGKGIGKGDGKTGITAVDKFVNTLRKIIKKNYNLPPSYDQEGGKLTVTIAIKIDAQGNLMAIEIVNSSKDRVFDEYTIKAAKSAVPFPPPPQELRGEWITLRFKS